MGESIDRGERAAALAAAHAALDVLARADLTAGSDEQLLADWRELERLARRVPSVEARLVLAAEDRALPATVGAKTTGQFVAGLLGIDGGDGSARVRSAEAIGARHTLTGEPLPPAYPVLAAAQAEGSVSAHHAAMLVRAIEELPDEIRPEHAGPAEVLLVEQATQLRPRQFAQLTRRLVDLLDPDGKYRDEHYRVARRGFSLQVRPDGSSTCAGELTPELTELLLTHFDALAAPRPESDGVKDPRTAGQRRHDALLDSLKLVIRAGQLPSTNGVSTTVVVTMTEQAYRTRSGLARTAHGSLAPTAAALDWGGADTRLLAVVLSRIRGVEAYSGTQRLFTEIQRLTMIARDGGCTFPGCTAPPAWCEAHHLIDYADGGPTVTHNGGLVCGNDHRNRIAEGWTAELIDGRIGWRPPAWIDPERRPRFNSLHRPIAA